MISVVCIVSALAKFISLSILEGPSARLLVDLMAGSILESDAASLRRIFFYDIGVSPISR